jgi:hypothetical protein
MARLRDKMDSHHENLMVIMKASREKKEAAMMEACLEKTKAIGLEANPEEIELMLLCPLVLVFAG